MTEKNFLLSVRKKGHFLEKTYILLTKGGIYSVLIRFYPFESKVLELLKFQYLNIIKGSPLKPHLVIPVKIGIYKKVDSRLRGNDKREQRRK